MNRWRCIYILMEGFWVDVLTTDDMLDDIDLGFGFSTKEYGFFIDFSAYYWHTKSHNCGQEYTHYFAGIVLLTRALVR